MWKENEKLRGLNIVKVLVQDHIIYFVLYVAFLLKLHIINDT